MSKEDSLKVTIVTVVYNNDKYINGAIESVISQNYPSIEYIVIDGGSTDNTLEVIRKHSGSITVFLSERDDGVYDALNKAISLASGDVIAILHSDDIFCDQYVVTDMVNKMVSTEAELCFSDMLLVNSDSDKVLRYYMASYFNPWLFRIGWMPPHPTCFIKKSLFDEFGVYSLDYKVAGDFDFLVRMFSKRDIKWAYLGRITVKMRRGGISNSGLVSKKIIASEINCSLKRNSVWSLPIFQLGRYVIRMVEMLIKPRASCAK